MVFWYISRSFVYFPQLTIFSLVDLAEVMSVIPAPPAPGPPKKTDDKSFFDVSIYSIYNEDFSKGKYFRQTVVMLSQS